MAPKIRADRDASAEATRAARKRADAHFGGKKAAQAEKVAAAGETLKATVLDLQLPDRADYATHLKTISACKEKVATATGLLRNAKKRARESGIDPKEIDDAIYWKEKAPEDFNRWLAGTLRACEVNGMQVPQVSFFDTSGLTADEKAFQDGHRAGISGSSYAMNPHQLGSAGAARWEEGRQRGQAELAGKSFGAGGTVPSAAPAEGGALWPDDEQIAAQGGDEGDDLSTDGEEGEGDMPAPAEAEREQLPQAA